MRNSVLDELESVLGKNRSQIGIDGWLLYHGVVCHHHAHVSVLISILALVRVCEGKSEPRVVAVLSGQVCMLVGEVADTQVPFSGDACGIAGSLESLSDRDFFRGKATWLRWCDQHTPWELISSHSEAPRQASCLQGCARWCTNCSRAHPLCETCSVCSKTVDVGGGNVLSAKA